MTCARAWAGDTSSTAPINAPGSARESTVIATSASAPRMACRGPAKAGRHVLIDLLRLGDDDFGRRDAGGDHHLANRGFGVGRRLEVAEPVADGDRERRPAEP